jgi:hypothetical protein
MAMAVSAGAVTAGLANMGAGMRGLTQALMMEGGGDSARGGGDRSPKTSSAGKMEKEVERGQAPRGVDRVDTGNRRFGEKDHVHLDDGRALNNDGTWKHGEGSIGRTIQDWLGDHGWKVP